MDDPSFIESFADLLSGRRNDPVWLPVLSGSMAPLLLPGDEVLVQPCSWEECSVGEVIVFRQELSLTAHRLVYKLKIFTKILLFQQGDAMKQGGIISPEAVVGKCLLGKREGEEFTLDEERKNYNTIVKRKRKRLIYQSVKDALKWILRKMHISRFR